MNMEDDEQIKNDLVITSIELRHVLPWEKNVCLLLAAAKIDQHILHEDHIVRIFSNLQITPGFPPLLLGKSLIPETEAFLLNKDMQKEKNQTRVSSKIFVWTKMKRILTLSVYRTSKGELKQPLQHLNKSTPKLLVHRHKLQINHKWKVI